VIRGRSKLFYLLKKSFMISKAPEIEFYVYK